MCLKIVKNKLITFHTEDGVVFLYYFNTQYKIVNARYPTPVTSSLPPSNIRLKMMVKYQYKGVLKN